MSDVQTLNLALCAVNLAEASYPVIDKQLLVEVYVLVAVTIRQRFGEHLRPLAVSIMESVIVYYYYLLLVQLPYY